MPGFAYPTVQRLQEIEQDLLPVLTAEDPIFDAFPIEDDQDDVLRWEQLDNYRGLQSIRGLNGDPPAVTRTGAKSYLAQPGVYGEYEMIDERELTKRRKFGSFDEKIDISDLIMEVQNHLLTRELSRMRYLAWTLATTGTIQATDKDGAVLYKDTFPIPTFTANPLWSTPATSTPLADLRQVKLLARGHSVDFGTGATLYLNQSSLNLMLANTNPADIGGKRVIYGATVNSEKDLNTLFLENGLPQVRVYEGGYYDSAGQWQLFIPTGTAVLFGQRPNGRPVGAYRRVFNAVSKNPGSYLQIVDDENDVPPRIVVHRGHNGGTIIRFPSAIVDLKVA